MSSRSEDLLNNNGLVNEAFVGVIKACSTMNCKEFKCECMELARGWASTPVFLSGGITHNSYNNLPHFLNVPGIGL